MVILILSILTEITDPIFSGGLSLRTRFVQVFLSLVHKAKPKMGSVIFIPSLIYGLENNDTKIYRFSENFRI